MASRATLEQFRRRLGPDQMARVFDDNGDGSEDESPAQQCLDDARAKIDSYLAPLGILSALTEPFPHELIRLELDVAVAYAAQRFPEAMPHHDWLKLMDQAEKDLCRLRDGKTMLGVYPTAPDPPANHGGEVYNNTATAIAASDAGETSGFWDDTGDF